MINLAIVAPNKDKYSETFIHNHVQLLKGNVLFLFDGYLPARYSEDRGATERLFKVRPLLPRFTKSRNRETFHLQSIVSFLLKHKTDAVLAEYGPTGVEMMTVCAAIQIPLIVHFHGYDAYRNDILTTYGKKYIQLFSVAAAVICVSADMKHQLISLGCPGSKIHFLPYGVSGTIFRQDQSVEKNIDFIFCGRFVAKKAPLKLLEAFKIVNTMLPGTSLHMIGDGEMLAQCLEFVSVNGLTKQVTFRGVLSQTEIAAAFNKSRVYVQHSVVTADNDSEGTPLSILEAGSCGLPVVATRHAGIADVVVDKMTGYLVEENDSEAMAERMIFLAKQPMLAAAMGAAAAQHVSENYSLDVSITKLQHTISQAAGFADG